MHVLKFYLVVFIIGIELISMGQFYLVSKSLDPVVIGIFIIYILMFLLKLKKVLIR